MSGRTLALKYAGICRSCGAELQVGMEAVWFKGEKSVECVTCPMEQVSDPFDAGRLPDLGVAGGNVEVLATSRTNAGTLRKDAAAFAKGADGERLVAAVLEQIPLSTVLHSRRKGPRSDIDHIVICPSGVWVVDAKNYKGEVTSGIFGDNIRIGGRQPDKLIAGLVGQVERVRDSVPQDTPVRGALALVGVEWATLRRLLKVKRSLIASPLRLASHIGQQRVVLDRSEQRLDVAQLVDKTLHALQRGLLTRHWSGSRTQAE